MTEDQKAALTMEAFATYARSRRIVLNNAIKPHRFPGRGLGIAATKKIQVCSGLFSFRCVLLYRPLHYLHALVIFLVTMDAVLTRVHPPW